MKVLVLTSSENLEFRYFPGDRVGVFVNSLSALSVDLYGWVDEDKLPFAITDLKQHSGERFNITKLRYDEVEFTDLQRVRSAILEACTTAISLFDNKLTEAVVYSRRNGFEASLSVAKRSGKNRTLVPCATCKMPTELLMYPPSEQLCKDCVEEIQKMRAEGEL